MKAVRFIALCLAAPFAAHVCTAQTQDAQGCKDSPLISRFPGSVITECRDKGDDKFTFTLDKGQHKAVEGEFHLIRYNFPNTASKAQVVRNLNTALRRAGYTMVYDSGDYGDFTGHMGKTWIQIEIGGGGTILETIVVETALTQILGHLEELSTRHNAPQLVSSLLKQFDIVTGLSAWSDPRLTH